MKKLLLVICAVLSFNVLTAQKNVLVEESTGTWCPNCPSGIYYIDSLSHTYDNVIAIAVHTLNDPMAYNDYSDKLGFDSAPSASINRRNSNDTVDRWFSLVQREMEIQPKSTVSVTTQFEEATRLLTATVTITALQDIEGEYRISGVVCEDAVTGPSPFYNQANIYAQYAFYPMGGYENMPNPIPAHRIAYDHVARQVLGNLDGETGFPATLAAGQTFAQTFTYTLPEGYDHNYVRVVGMFLEANGVVDNAGISQYLNGSLNAAPKFTSTPVLNVPASVQYLYNIYVHDTDDKNFMVSVEQKPEWLTFERYDRKSAAIYGMTDKAGEYEVILKVSDGKTETFQEYTIVVGEALNASWETLGERAFSTVGYGYILGTCSYNGNIYTFMYESGFPALYEYSAIEKQWKKLISPMDEIGFDGGIAAGTDGVYVIYYLKANNLIKVKKYADGEWSDLGNIGKIGNAPKIAVGSDNTVYVSFNDEGENGYYYVHKYKNGNWEQAGASYVSAGGGSWARLALDTKDIPYVSWVDFYAGRVMYVSKLVGEAWLKVGNAPVCDSIYIDKNYQDLAIDADGNIYLAYCATGTEYLTVCRHNSAEWELLSDNVVGGPVKGIDVAISSNQSFYVSFSDANYEDKVSVMKYDGKEWSSVGQRGFTESKTDSYLAMTLHQDSPCVVYTDVAMGSKISAKYYKRTDYLYPPVNLEAKVISATEIELTWDAPFGTEPTKYNIYRNESLIGYTAQVSYIDEDLETGVYSYEVSAVYEEGESEKTEVATVNYTVSISENNEVVFAMYPNPAENYITIESADVAEVKIYSINGQMLLQQSINEGINTIDLSNLNSGMYFISVNETMVKIVKK